MSDCVQLAKVYLQLIDPAPSPTIRVRPHEPNIAAMSIAQAVIDAQRDGFVVGLKTDQVLPRLEIDEFILDKDVLNLFLLALIQLQDDKIHTEPFSWYQIAGECGVRKNGLVCEGRRH